MSLCSFLPPVIILSGAFFIIKLRGFFILHPIRTLRRAFSGGELSESVLSLLLALSGTLGVGNILGVAVGISLGGAGSVFWLLVSSLFSCALKYAEVLISSDTGEGLGIISVIKRSLGSHLSHLYTLLVIILSITMGSALQATAVREAAEGIGGNFSRWIALPLAILIPIVTLFGKRGIKNAVAVIIPIASVTYTVLCLFVIIPNATAVPGVICEVIECALAPNAAVGGIAGAITASGMLWNIVHPVI